MDVSRDIASYVHVVTPPRLSVLLRTLADMENLRKRAEREKAEATLYAATNFARDLLIPLVLSVLLTFVLARVFAEGTVMREDLEGMV